MWCTDNSTRHEASPNFSPTSSTSRRTACLRGKQSAHLEARFESTSRLGTPNGAREPRCAFATQWLDELSPATRRRVRHSCGDSWQAAQAGRSELRLHWPLTNTSTSPRSKTTPADDGAGNGFASICTTSRLGELFWLRRQKRRAKGKMSPAEGGTALLVYRYALRRPSAPSLGCQKFRLIRSTPSKGEKHSRLTPHHP